MIFALWTVVSRTPSGDLEAVGALSYEAAHLRKAALRASHPDCRAQVLPVESRMTDVDLREYAHFLAIIDGDTMRVIT